MTLREKRILVICPFPVGIAPAQRLKYEQYFDDWRANGFSVDVSPFMSRPLFDVAWTKGHLATKIFGTLRGTLRRWRDLLHIRRYDLVYVFLWVMPLGTTWSERLVRKLAKRLVYDIDDNVHLGQELDNRINPNRLLRFLKGRGKAIYLMRTADHVIASSPFLEQSARELNRGGRATYITSSVDVDHFRPRSWRPDNRKCVIGWTGTFSSQPFLDSLAPMLRKLSETHEFEFRIVGNFDYAMPGVDLKVVRFDKAREIADLEHFDIGVYPLIDDPFVYGKSGLKAIVYMAMGLPVVASAIGTTPLVVRDGANGFLVNNEDGWLKALRSLIDDPELRRTLGEQARRDAVAKFSVQAVANQYRQVLASVMDGPAGFEDADNGR
jgi:glycosyltransferase involved in cell wall biosynthesis